jgi:hypothetical protein
MQGRLHGEAPFQERQTLGGVRAPLESGILKNQREFNYTLIFLRKIGYGIGSPWAGMAASP